jgi:hypothetical protein
LIADAAEAVEKVDADELEVHANLARQMDPPKENPDDTGK